MSYFDFENHFIEVRLPPDNFLKVKETLTRIGVPSYKDTPDGVRTRTLWQSCHILYKRQRYWIVHFKEMFLLDGKHQQTHLTDDDLARRNCIALLLAEWGLLEIISTDRVGQPVPAPLQSVKIIPYREKHEWQLRAKYEIGKPRKG